MERHLHPEQESRNNAKVHIGRLTGSNYEASKKVAKEQKVLPESRWRRATYADLSRRGCGSDGRKPTMRSWVDGEQTPFWTSLLR